MKNSVNFKYLGAMPFLLWSMRSCDFVHVFLARAHEIMDSFKSLHVSASIYVDRDHLSNKSRVSQARVIVFINYSPVGYPALTKLSIVSMLQTLYNLAVLLDRRISVGSFPRRI
jgi:hypothetical protein